MRYGALLRWPLVVRLLPLTTPINEVALASAPLFPVPANLRVRTVRGAMPMNTFLEVLNALAGTGTSYIIVV